MQSLLTFSFNGFLVFKELSEVDAAVRTLLRDVVVVDSLEDAEALLAARPWLTAVTAEGDLL
ncbi:MAG: hypothetical protein ACTHKY_01075, partial [Ginsengibacter sp.]